MLTLNPGSSTINRLYCVQYFVLLMKYTLGSPAPSNIFQYQHKTLNNLNILNHTIDHYQRYRCMCIIKNLKAKEGSHFRMCDVTQPKLDIHV